VLSTARKLLSFPIASDSLEYLLRSLNTASEAMERRIRILQRDVAVSLKEADDLASNLDDVLNLGRIGLNRTFDRRAFEVSLKAGIERLGPLDEPLSVFICRPDRLDQIRANWGDRVHDQLLALVAHALDRQTRFDHGALRIGPEEFGTVLEYRAAGEAAEVGEKIRVAFQGRALVRKSTSERLGRITISIGIAQYADGERASDLVLRAEACLELAGQLGGNIVIADTDPLFTSADIDAA
jgi:diguanylate cyclase